MKGGAIREVKCFCRICTGGWGGEPVEPGEDWDGSANVNILVACDCDVEEHNAIRRMSAIPVNLEPVNAARSEPAALVAE